MKADGSGQPVELTTANRVVNGALTYGKHENASFPAFRFSFQGLTENNHRAFWTLDVRDPPPGESCAQLNETCESDADCCVGTSCYQGEFGGTCQYPPECIPEGGACDEAGAGNPCCAGTFCQEQTGGAFACSGVQLG